MVETANHNLTIIIINHKIQNYQIKQKFSKKIKKNQTKKLYLILFKKNYQIQNYIKLNKIFKN